MQAALGLIQDHYIHYLILLMTVGLLASFGKASPSRATFLWLLLPSALMLFGFWWPPLVFAGQVGNVVLFVTLLIDRFLLSVEPGDIEMKRTVSHQLSINQDNAVLLSLYNNSTQPVTATVVDSPPKSIAWGHSPQSIAVGNSRGFTTSLPPRQRVALEYTLKPHARGTYQFGKIYLRYASRLGLLWISKQAGRLDRISVYPDLKRLRQMRVSHSKSVNLGEIRKRSLGQEGTQFAGLRSYGVGDDVRRIDWRATARMDSPIVRTYTPEVDQPILVLIDGGRKMMSHVDGLSKFDWALNAALAFAGVALDRGDQVGLGVFHAEMAELSTIAGGTRQLQQLLEQFHGIQPAPVEPVYERIMLQSARLLRRRSLVIVFTDLIDPMASRNLVQSLGAFSNSHLLVVVTLSDSETERLALQQVENATQLYEKAVALDLMGLREKTLRELTRHYGAVVVDTRPEKMDETLINRYMRIKASSRL